MKIPRPYPRGIEAECSISKSQYEDRFRKWGFRKNLKGAEWGVIRHHVSKRKREGKDSNLYVDGILVPAKKVRKETSRNTFVSLRDPVARGKGSLALAKGVI